MLGSSHHVGIAADASATRAPAVTTTRYTFAAGTQLLHADDSWGKSEGGSGIGSVEPLVPRPTSTAGKETLYRGDKLVHVWESPLACDVTRPR